jgi:serine/threonine protein kinase/Flp pilus assembly protein TadD
MNSERPSTYEQLSVEAAARIDAVCDDFEKAWKAARSGAVAPRLSTYLDSCEGPERTALASELLALDRACRERYGRAGRPEHSTEHGVGANAAATSAASADHRHTDVTAPRPADWPSVPGLELVDVVGAGGMGVVFKARQVALDRDVAVKFLRDAQVPGSGRRERFLQEARAVARLRHPHLVQLYEFGEVRAAGGAASQPYLVLEYVSGGSLADFARSSPQPPGEVARLVETAAGAIHYAHQQGVIHRDLKPANVLLQRTEVEGERQADGVRGLRFSPTRPLTAELCAKVTDFGLAKFLSGGELTHSGDVIGTPGYMAPEQAAGKSAPITVAVDVYGLGAILYEALTGRPPFAAATVEATLGQVRLDEPVPPRRLQPTVPRDLETICLKCLRKEAGRRYATAGELAQDLRRFRAGEPVQARPVGTLERITVWCRRNPGFAALVAALVLVFLAGSSGVLWQWQRAHRNAADARRIATAFRRERDTARQEKARAERHLQMVRDRVDRLNRLGGELLRRPGLYRTGQAVLEEALAFYQELLPEEGNDPRVRRAAAQLFDQVAWIHHTLNQASKAAAAWGRRASLLTSLLEEEPASKDLEEGLVHEFPNEARYKVALANTLLNMAGQRSEGDQTAELEPLYRRILELERAAVRIAPLDPACNAELALALGAQGLFFLDTGRGPEAEAALREALEIHQRVLAEGRIRDVEPYAARNFASLGRVLLAAGRATEAEQSYRKAVNLLDRAVEKLPELVYPRADLAQTLAGLADLLKDLGRRQEALEIRHRVIRHYEMLKADYAEDPQLRRSLVLSYLELVRVLCDLGRQAEAAEPLRKALEMDKPDPAVNNDLAWFLATNPEPRLRDGALAVRLAQKAVTGRPESGNYMNTLGAAYYRNGDDKAAVGALETSMSMRAGGDSFDWFFLAMAHRRLGDRDKAQMWFERAVQWMDRHKPQNDELSRFRAEAKAMLADSGKP